MLKSKSRVKDIAFAEVFSDYNLQKCLKILVYGSREAHLEAVPTITAKAVDMVEHCLTHVFPNGFKTQVAATSHKAAVRYKTAMDNALPQLIEKLEQDNL